MSIPKPDIEVAPAFTKLFYLKETHGVPIQTTCMSLKDNGMVVDWPKFYIDGLKAGCNVDGLVISMEHCVMDVWGKDYFIEWQNRFRLWIVANHDNTMKEVWG